MQRKMNRFKQDIYLQKTTSLPSEQPLVYQEERSQAHSGELSNTTPNATCVTYRGSAGKTSHNYIFNITQKAGYLTRSVPASFSVCNFFYLSTSKRCCLVVIIKQMVSDLSNMTDKILPTCLQGNYRYSLGEFSNTSYGVFGAEV